MSIFDNVRLPRMVDPTPPPKASSNITKAIQVPAKSALESEIARILKLPVIEEMTKEEVEAYSKMTILSEAYQGTGMPGGEPFRLLSKQAEALAAYELYTGPFLPIGVGGGKTGISLMIPEKAFRDKGMRKMLLIIPSNMAHQLINIDIPFWVKRTPISYPIHLLIGRTMKKRQQIAKLGRPGLYIMGDGQLSSQDASELLEQISPELIVVDEAHIISSRTSARAKRVQRILDTCTPEFVPMSGTITSKSLMDYLYLAKHSLRENCFLPRSSTMAMEWAELLDAEVTKNVNDTSHWRPGILKPLLDWAQNERGIKLSKGIAGFRDAYAERMATAPGVVTSGGELDLPGTMTFKNERIPYAELDTIPGWDKVQELGQQVDELYITPNGDELDHAMLAWKWQYQIYGAGFYTELVWPSSDFLSQKYGFSHYESEDIIVKAQTHLEAGNEYHKFLRNWLQEKGRPGLDTPLLVGRDMYVNQDTNVGPSLYAYWSDWKDTEFEQLKTISKSRDTDEYGRLRNAVRLCDFKIQRAVKWAKSVQSNLKRGKKSLGRGGIIWFYHNEIGEWAYEELVKAGVDPLYCPAGKQHDASIIDTKNHDRIILASIGAHHKGKNLQYTHKQFLLQWPRASNIAEQLLGRQYRQGQKADDVETWTCNCTEWDDLIFAATLNDSLYIHQTTRTPQRMIIAKYQDVPRIFPGEVLREKVEKVYDLSPGMRELFKEKFGKHA